MLFWQILIDGFAISSLYALGATGFTLIFGVRGAQLSHGAIMVAAVAAATISEPWERLSTPETPKISAKPVAPSA